jgi:mRNA interferase MazF
VQVPPRKLRRGDVWWIDADPVRGHEQAGTRPAVVVSADDFNTGPTGLIVVCPLTRTDYRSPLHVAVDPPDGGLRSRSFVLCEQIRAVSIERLESRVGRLGIPTVASIDRRLRLLLDLRALRA